MCTGAEPAAAGTMCAALGAGASAGAGAGAGAGLGAMAFTPEMIAAGTFTPGSIGALGAAGGALTGAELAAASGIGLGDLFSAGGMYADSLATNPFGSPNSLSSLPTVENTFTAIPEVQAGIPPSLPPQTYGTEAAMSPETMMSPNGPFAGNADKAALYSNAGYGEAGSSLGNMFKTGWETINKPMMPGGPSYLKAGKGLYDMFAKNQMADKQQQQLDALAGMYMPGTPEAKLMESNLARLDAKSGRNSQYASRATNLAAMLAGQRANIMGGAGYQNLHNNMLNNRYGSLNTLFSTFV